MTRVSSKKYLAGSRGQCSVPGCVSYGRIKVGLCPKHYQRLRKTGSLDQPKGRISKGASFINEIIESTSNDCIIWPFARKNNGYAVLTFGSRTTASRYVCERVNGAPPTPEHEAAHSCGNGHLGCINPNHLSWKTPKENKADELVHGTRNLGERNGSSKLTVAAVEWIRFHAGKFSADYMAERLSVDIRTIKDVLEGKTWAWLR